MFIILKAHHKKYQTIGEYDVFTIRIYHFRIYVVQTYLHLLQRNNVQPRIY